MTSRIFVEPHSQTVAMSPIFKHRRSLSAAAVAAALVLSACGSDSPTATTAGSTTTGTDAGAGVVDQSEIAFREQMTAVDAAVAAWRTADSIRDAHAAAETAANLIVGPNGPDYGDRDGDGVIGGETTFGVLPGLDGTPAGTALGLEPNECVDQDVLGGSWDDPMAEWDKMISAIDAWRPSNNTMPSLDSHPMRSVGWATFTLATDSLEEAQGYAGHAKLHVDISVNALDC